MAAGRPDSSLLAALMPCSGWPRVTCPPSWLRSCRCGARPWEGWIEGRYKGEWMVEGLSCRPFGVAPRLFRRLRLPVSDVAPLSLQGMDIGH